MTKPNPFKDRKERKNSDKGTPAGTAVVPGQGTALPEVPSTFSSGGNGQPVVAFAQGRAEKMLTFADLPDPVETPDATGDLSQEEEEILALCMQAFKQFENAWWVTAKGMANVNARKLYRKTHPTFEAFARDVFNKSRPLAYEEMAAYPIGELLSARADKAFEENSNDVSARADTPAISKKAAGAYNPITKDYGPEVSVAVHETITDATGRNVPVKTITGIVQQLPRKEEKELTQEELTALARELAAQQQNDNGSTDKPEKAEKDAGSSTTPALDALRAAVDQLESAHRGLAPAKIKKALEEDPAKAAVILADAKSTADKASKRAEAYLPE
ncbi:hypothetical protein ABZ135_32805 [Streptomyces sp. NPDC006339]|uniref:hypothetical protein n=1 Tax=Streptomyces sp. NPDC006339 TaxID=3156755 RepID=UPI0033B739C7